jgi:serum/glucocorticoid-regulated kinase 2
MERKEERRKSTRTLYSFSGTKPISIDDFELIKTLGRGAHGKVLLCERRNYPGERYALKIIKKQHIIDAKQFEHTLAEKIILSSLNHPFLVSLKYAFQTDEKIYFVMEFMKGGELFQHLRRNKSFSEEQTKFVAACIVLALGHLHNHNFIYRDLKPENVLMDERGFAKLTDFGLAKHLDVADVAFTFCGTPEYLAPEVILDKGCNRPADWWSLGILVYEMLYGLPPFYSKDVQEMYKKTILDPLKFKPRPNISDEAKDFITGLLMKAPSKRLGSLADNLEVMNHAWFKDINWIKLMDRKLTPLFNPNEKEWERNFDPGFIKEVPKDSLCAIDPKLASEYREKFKEFEFKLEDDEIGIGITNEVHDDSKSKKDSKSITSLASTFKETLKIDLQQQQQTNESNTEVSKAQSENGEPSNGNPQPKAEKLDMVIGNVLEQDSKVVPESEKDINGGIH